jgi:hypothetical protein
MRQNRHAECPSTIHTPRRHFDPKAEKNFDRQGSVAQRRDPRCRTPDADIGPTRKKEVTTRNQRHTVLASPDNMAIAPVPRYLCDNSHMLPNNWKAMQHSGCSESSHHASSASPPTAGLGLVAFSKRPAQMFTNSTSSTWALSCLCHVCSGSGNLWLATMDWAPRQPQKCHLLAPALRRLVLSPAPETMW